MIRSEGVRRRFSIRRLTSISFLYASITGSAGNLTAGAATGKAYDMAPSRPRAKTSPVAGGTPYVSGLVRSTVCIDDPAPGPWGDGGLVHAATPRLPVTLTSTTHRRCPNIIAVLLRVSRAADVQGTFPCVAA